MAGHSVGNNLPMINLRLPSPKSTSGILIVCSIIFYFEWLLSNGSLYMKIVQFCVNGEQ